MIESGNNVFSFGEFVLDTERRVLLRDGEAVPLKSKAFDVLRTLVERRGQVLSKNQLLDIVWESQFVEENNLTVHVTALRKALGETKNEHRYIVTIPGKGYSFVGEFLQPSNGSVVVSERRTFEKIVVDEEIEEVVEDFRPGEPVAFDANGQLTASSPSRRWKITGALALVAVVLFGIAGAYSFRSQLADNLFGKTVPFAEHEVVQLTTNGKIGSAALSPDGKLFAYVIDDVGLKSLWIGNVDGGNHLQLRPASETTFHTLVFSPDSGQLYFSIRDDKNPNGALYRIHVLGGVATKLKDDIGIFTLSPDGTHLATGRRDLDKDAVVVSRLDGTESRDIVSFPKRETFLVDSVSWSPDGNRIALSLQRPGRLYRHDLAVVDVASGELTRTTLADYREITNTSWLRDGTGLIITAIEETSHSSVPQYRLVHVSYPDGVTTALTTDRSNYGASWHNDSVATLSLDSTDRSMLAVEHRQLSNVWVAPAGDLAAARQITFSSFGRYDGLWGLDWTPDGRIIYTTSDTKNQYLAEMNADGDAQKPLTDPTMTPGHVDSVLTVSSDGRYILFHSNRLNGEFDIWRAEIDGSNPTQLTFGGKNFIPAPSPDGQWVYYKSWMDDIGRMCRVAVDGGDPECLTDKETTWASFSPDGSLIAASYITDRQRLAIFSATTHEIIDQFELPKTGTLYMGSRWTADGKSVTYRDTAFGYWIQDIEGGEPRRLEGLPKEKFYNFSWSRDGNHLAFVRGQEIRDVVLFRRKE